MENSEQLESNEALTPLFDLELLVSNYPNILKEMSSAKEDQDLWKAVASNISFLFRSFSNHEVFTPELAQGIGESAAYFLEKAQEFLNEKNEILVLTPKGRKLKREAKAEAKALAEAQKLAEESQKEAEKAQKEAEELRTQQIEDLNLLFDVQAKNKKKEYFLVTNDAMKPFLHLLPKNKEEGWIVLGRYKVKYEVNYLSTNTFEFRPQKS